MQSVLITTKVVSSNPVHGEVYSIHYVIKFVSDLRQVGGFLRVILVPSTDRHDKTEILLKVKLSTIKPTNQPYFSYKVRDFNKGRHPAICRRFKRVKSPVRLLETKIFFH